jgi:hypothetical protein
VWGDEMRATTYHIPQIHVGARRMCRFDTMPSIFLLPVVANVVNAALGGMIGFQFTADEGRSMWILFCSMVELGCGLFSGMYPPWPCFPALSRLVPQTPCANVGYVWVNPHAR